MEAVRGHLTNNCIFMINGIHSYHVMLHHSPRSRSHVSELLSRSQGASTQKLYCTNLNVVALFSLLPKSHFVIQLRFYMIMLQSTLSYQILTIKFFCFFLYFFFFFQFGMCILGCIGNLENCFWNFLQTYTSFFFSVVYGHQFICSCSVHNLQIIGSSKLKVGCKKDAIHDTFYVLCVMYSYQQLQYVFQSCPVMVDTVRSLHKQPEGGNKRYFVGAHCANEGGWGHG